MGIGILICGLNGTGKSTLGKVLAEILGFHCIDNEDLFFPKTNPNYLFDSPRSREEVEKLLMNEIQEHENFVFIAVKGNYGEDCVSLYKYAVLIDVPKEIRLQRVKNRSLVKFGHRMLPGGDLYEQEESFFKMVSARPEHYVDEWAQTLECPIIKIDGTKPIEENVAYIIEKTQNPSL